MLVRAFRVTDRLGNALLRISAWSAVSIVEQAAHLKNGLFGILLTTWRVIAGSVMVAVMTVTGTARRTRQAYEVVESTSARRSEPR